MAAVKKKAAKKKGVKKTAAVRKTAMKKVAGGLHIDPKLGHDPLAWLAGDDAEIVSTANIVIEPEIENEVQLTIADEIEKNDEGSSSDSILPVETETPVETPVETAVETAAVTVVEHPDVPDKEKDENMLNLPDVFGIAQAEVMYDEISKLLTTAEDIQIDASAVETVDGSALQLLISMVNECKSQGKKIIWHAKSEKINDSAKLLNLTESLAL